MREKTHGLLRREVEGERGSEEGLRSLSTGQESVALMGCLYVVLLWRWMVLM